MAAEDEPRAGAGAGAGAGQAGADQPQPSAAGLAGPGALAGVSRSGVLADCWSPLRALTPARLALGRAGASMPTIEVLRFGWDHAQARDAVQHGLDAAQLAREIEAIGFATRQVASRAPDRAVYLMRPDLGRRLDPASAQQLEADAGEGCDLLLVVGDGLSSAAVTRHAPAVLAQIRERAEPSWRLGPVVIASQARVALGDEIGERLRAAMVAVLIGERPGLSSPDSLGIYFTWAPRVGRQDSERNCISNIRPQGLAYAQAAHTLVWLCREGFRLKRSGVGLKDRSDLVDINALERTARISRA